MPTKTILSLALMTALMLAAAPVLAQTPAPVTATVDRTSLTTDDILTLTVSVTADSANPPQPVLPSLSGFTVVGSNTSSQISIINGVISSQLIYNYQLQPGQSGQLTIDPVSLTLNGQTYTTAPITVQVSPGTGAPTPAQPSRPITANGSGLNGQKTYVEAEVSNATPYLGEPIVYTFRYYQALDAFDLMLNQPQFEPPAFTGFWSETQPGQKQGQLQADGVLYNVTELSTVLVPTRAGEITIEPAKLVLPGSFFNRGGELQSQPVSVTVKPLPAGAPANFGGAVGQFQLEAGTDITQTKVNEPITWHVTLSGRGNINTAADPVWPDVPNWRSFESQATTTAQPQNGQMAGSKTYERLLVPQAAGKYTLPALEYSYFDPALGQYQTTRTEPIQVGVEPGQSDVAAGGYTASAPGDAGRPTPATLTSDFRYLKPVPGSLRSGLAPLTRSPLYWLAWGIPLAALIGNLFWQRRQNYWATNAHLARSSLARKKADRALAWARHNSGDHYEAVHQILTAYLADKLNQPVAGLTRRALAEALAGRGLEPELIERVTDCLAETELGRFSPAAADGDRTLHLLNDVEQLLNDLEKAF